MNERDLPTPNELMDAPELAVLAVLDYTLEATMRTIIATYPELNEDRLPRHRLDSVISGSRLLHRAIKLQVALERYRKVVLRTPTEDSDATDDLEALTEDERIRF